jgi:hypothetical protein
VFRWLTKVHAEFDLFKLHAVGATVVLTHDLPDSVVNTELVRIASLP